MRRFLALIAVCLFWAGSSQALTLSEIRTQIRRNVRDTATDSSFQRYSDSVLTSFVNEEQKDVVNQTWCLITSTSIALTARTTWYDLPTDFLAVHQVRFLDSSSNYRELTEVSLKGLYQEDPDWESTAGAPNQYVVRQALDSDNPLEVGFRPVAGSGQTGTVVLEYFDQPTDLSSDSDVPFEGFLHLVPYHQTLVYKVTARIKFIEGLGDEGVAYFQLYKDAVNNMKDRLGMAPNFNPSFGTTIHR